MQATKEQITAITLKFTEDEFNKFIEGIGATSHNDRVSAGMTVSQSQFFNDLYQFIDEQGLIKP